MHISHTGTFLQRCIPTCASVWLFSRISSFPQARRQWAGTIWNFTYFNDWEDDWIFMTIDRPSASSSSLVLLRFVYWVSFACDITTNAKSRFHLVAFALQLNALISSSFTRALPACLGACARSKEWHYWSIQSRFLKQSTWTLAPPLTISKHNTEAQGCYYGGQKPNSALSQCTTHLDWLWCAVRMYVNVSLWGKHQH